MIKFKAVIRFYFILILFVLGLGLMSYGGDTEEDQDTGKAEASSASSPVISMDLKNADLKDILKALSIQSGMNFVASEEIEGRQITLYLDKVSVKEAMDKLLKASNLDYEFYEESKIILVKGKESKPMITKLFQLKYTRVSSSPIDGEIEKALGKKKAEGGGGKEAKGVAGIIQTILSKEGTVVEDARTNTLIITDFPERFPIIEEAIKELDIPVPQVTLEVEMLDVSKNLIDKLGFEFGDSPLTMIIPDHGGRLTRFFLGDLTYKSADLYTSGVEGNVVLGSSFAYLLDFLKTQTDTRYLARPKIMTLNNETAEIKIITQEVIGEEVTYDDQGNIAERTAERYETGVSLRITPQINMETGEITMFLSPRVIEASTSTFSSNYRDPEERSTNSLVKVRDGETVVVGGLIRNVTNQTFKSLPILGDIPFLGALFRHKNKTKDIERELLVFITPHILKETISSQAKDKNVILSPQGQNVNARLSQIESALNTINTTQY